MFPYHSELVQQATALNYHELSQVAARERLLRDAEKSNKGRRQVVSRRQVLLALTGGRPTDDWNNKTEVLVEGGGPAQRCDQLSPWARADLARTLEIIRERGGNFAGGGQSSINEYARAVRSSDSNAEIEFPMPAVPDD